jgi:two-component sensor histidine kinase
MTSKDLNFDLAIDANPRFVSVVRRFVEDAFEKLVDDPEAVCRVSMTAHELMENAAKYSMGSKAQLRVSLKREGEAASLVLCLTNDTTPAHVSRLRERIEALAGPDPFERYQLLMRQNARRVDESGLGLARIRAEGEMALGLEVNGSTVAIMATGRIDGGKQ